MTKRDFVFLARLAASLPTDGTRSHVANSIASWCSVHYAAFDRTKFFLAAKTDDCNWPGAKETT